MILATTPQGEAVANKYEVWTRHWESDGNGRQISDGWIYRMFYDSLEVALGEAEALTYQKDGRGCETKIKESKWDIAFKMDEKAKKAIETKKKRVLLSNGFKSSNHYKKQK